MSAAHAMAEELVNGFGSLLYAPEFDSKPQVLLLKLFLRPALHVPLRPL
ncbi:MAG TPA: hypothetical protein VN924_20780 [Bryobacteraceae bacterium]|nr:hypothetical protein [Bryobacteraceae bacterium]